MNGPQEFLQKFSWEEGAGTPADIMEPAGSGVGKSACDVPGGTGVAESNGVVQSHEVSECVVQPNASLRSFTDTELDCSGERTRNSAEACCEEEYGAAATADEPAEGSTVA